MATTQHYAKTVSDGQLHRIPGKVRGYLVSNITKLRDNKSWFRDHGIVEPSQTEVDEYEQAIAEAEAEREAERQAVLEHHRNKIREMCQAFDMTFPTNITDAGDQIQALDEKLYTKALGAFTRIKFEIDEDSVSLKEVLNV